ncbi:MAG TPA: hypothetical protein PLE54_01640 [Burkholderiaceae bacterium]|nr:hypothetical protein [Burkholderiaceae bacterium]HQR69277.1 hypothetical protein [Burkholderiaceae bacterium]
MVIVISGSVAAAAADGEMLECTWGKCFAIFAGKRRNGATKTRNWQFKSKENAG